MATDYLNKVLANSVKTWDDDARAYNDALGLSQANKQRLLLPNEEMCRYPCSYTGDPGIEAPTITISLNPGWSQRTPAEHGRIATMDEWVAFCTNRFSAYGRDSEALHPVFHNLHRVLLYDGVRSSNEDKPNDLQSKLINLDWCPYYSEEFGNPRKKLSRKCMRLVNEWDDQIIKSIDHLKPSLIFLHGKNQLDLYNTLSGGTSKSLSISGKKFTNTIRVSHTTSGTRIAYSEYFLNFSVQHCNGYPGLDQMRAFIKDL
jgi:hypothetical protein